MTVYSPVNLESHFINDRFSTTRFHPFFCDQLSAVDKTAQFDTGMIGKGRPEETRKTEEECLNEKYYRHPLIVDNCVTDPVIMAVFLQKPNKHHLNRQPKAHTN